tara:strand:+ start:568 stop:777 length:210 start_codon:yes stop_codon:yes gene_type:complete
MAAKRILGTQIAQTAHLTSDEIETALAASSGVHDGCTGWQIVAQGTYADTGGASWAVAPTANRNNILGV